MQFGILLDKLKQLALPREQYVVVGAGSLAVRGIRETNDLDIVVTTRLWSKLREKYPTISEDSVEHLKANEYIEILGTGSIFTDDSIASVDEIIATADIFDGIRYINLDMLKRIKQKLARNKDLLDISLIDEYLLEDQLATE